MSKPLTLPTLPSPAKINRCLHIVGRREDGYHNLQSAFQLVELHDELTFLVTNNSSEITLHCEHPELSDDLSNNLIVKAAQALQTHTGCTLGVEITLDKYLPMGAGIGGGSSNAATTLLALNYLWQLKLEQTTLLDIARKLGADVPFFVVGETAWVEGIGEKITPTKLPETWFLILKPQVHISTKEIFSHPQLTRDTQITTIADFLEQGGQNDFEPLLRKLYPEIDNALIWLNKFSPAQLTGSGACIFACFATQDAAQEIATQVPKKYASYVTKACQRSALHQLLNDHHALY